MACLRRRRVSDSLFFHIAKESDAMPARVTASIDSDAGDGIAACAGSAGTKSLFASVFRDQMVYVTGEARR